MARRRRNRTTPPEAGVLDSVAQEGFEEVPERCAADVGQALFDAQSGGKHPDAKPLRGFYGPACSRWSRTTTAARTGQSTRSSLQGSSMCCTPSKRSRSEEPRRRREKSTR